MTILQDLRIIVIIFNQNVFIHLFLYNQIVTKCFILTSRDKINKRKKQNTPESGKRAHKSKNKEKI